MEEAPLKSHQKTPYSVQSGAIAGSVTAWCLAPMEILRTRMQSNQWKAWFQHKHPVLSMGKHIVNVEGPLALWKGSMLIAAGVGAGKAVYFGAYGACRQYSTQEPSFLTNAVFAGCASVLSVTVTCPIWAVKTAMQLHESRITVAGVVENILRTRGIYGMFKGLTASYVGIVESALQLSLYETWKEKAGQKWTPVTAGVSKFIPCVLMYPHEVLRTRMRQNDGTEGLFTTARLIVKQQGWRALYGGMGIHLVRSIPSAVLMFVLLETVAPLLVLEKQGEA